MEAGSAAQGCSIFIRDESVDGNGATLSSSTDERLGVVSVFTSDLCVVVNVDIVVGVVAEVDAEVDVEVDAEVNSDFVLVIFVNFSVISFLDLPAEMSSVFPAATGNARFSPAFCAKSLFFFSWKSVFKMCKSFFELFTGAEPCRGVVGNDLEVDSVRLQI